MAPLTPFWQQPSHPNVQKVQFSTEKDFTTKSHSTVTLPPFALFAKMAFPPCTLADKATYATVQIGREQHMNLNSDLVYINHSCVPSVIFDTTSLSILAGPAGLKPGQELTFFYPSTEWDMAQGFDCFCGASTCRGFVSGAKDMKPKDLEGLWLNAHIRNLLEERDGITKKKEGGENGKEHVNGGMKVGGAFGNTEPGFRKAVDVEVDPEQFEKGFNLKMDLNIRPSIPIGDFTQTAKGVQNGGAAAPALAQAQTNGKAEHKGPDVVEAALVASLKQAEKTVEAAKFGLSSYVSKYGKSVQNGGARENGVGSRALSGEMGGDTNGNGAEGEKRRGVTSREMSGEMGGDTKSVSLS